MPTKARYDRLKVERPDVWRREMKRDQEREAAKLLATFPARHPSRASEHKCAVCGAGFVPRRRGGSLQRFCSKRCQVSDMNRKRRVRCPDRVKLGLRKLAAKRRAAWRAYMATQHCYHCGEHHIACLEHHHIDPSTKAFPVAHWPYYRIEQVMKEVAKCIVLCANCHRKVEWAIRQKKWYAA